MNWKNSLVAAGLAIGAAHMAQATVEPQLYADTYIVSDGGRTYSVLDIYSKGDHLGDVMSAILGVTGHEVVFATSSAQGVTRDATSGKITAGSITSDIFVQSGGSSWLPTNTDGKAWDSFIANGNRGQGYKAKVTNRAGVVKDLGNPLSWIEPSGFGQMGVANSNFINNGTASGWYTAFNNYAYLSGTTAIASENPFARVSLYNSSWNSTYGDLYRGADVMVTKGRMQTGNTSATAGPVFVGAVGDALEFYSMIGRFAIDITNRGGEKITMQAQFNLVGRNGTGTESGTTFTGANASTAQYKVSNFFTFAAPPPLAPTGMAASDGTVTAGIALSWNASAWASSYSIYRSTGGQTAVQVGSSTSLSYTDTSAVPGTLYTYVVYANGATATSAASSPDTGWRRLSPPSNVSASDGAAQGRLDVTWSASVGATSYKLRRGPTGGTPAILGTVTGTTFSDLTANVGQVFDYSVIASCSLGDSDPSLVDSGYRINDCNGNGVDDYLESIGPNVLVRSLGSLVGGETRSGSIALQGLPVTDVTLELSAIGDLDAATEYVVVRLTGGGGDGASIVRDFFKNDGLGCPASAQVSSVTLPRAEFLQMMGNAQGDVRIDVTATPAVGGSDSLCQNRSTCSATLRFTGYNPAIDCTGNGIPDSCDIASGLALDCNRNGIPDSCDIRSVAFDCNRDGLIDSCQGLADCDADGVPDVCELAAGSETDLNSNGRIDRCEFLVGSPAFPSIAAAVAAVPSGGTVLVLPGTYAGPLDLGDKSLTLRSTGGAGSTFLTAGAGAPALRLRQSVIVEGFTITSGVGDRLTISRGIGEVGFNVQAGGAVVITGGAPTIRNSVIRNPNTTFVDWGGLVYIGSGSPVFEQCVFENGRAALGGAVYFNGGGGSPVVPRFIDCQVRGCFATMGGGIYCVESGARPDLLRVDFRNNSASGGGSAMALVSGARAALAGCVACGNSGVVVAGAYESTAINYMSDDCNADGLCDADQVREGALVDIDHDGKPDVCQDCDGDGLPDAYAIAQGLVADCNQNGTPDFCDLRSGTPDCNANGVPDSCDALNAALDCNRDGVVDSCQSLPDCNRNGRPDVCDIAAGLSTDCDHNNVMDSCEYRLDLDCNRNGILDRCDISAGREEDQDGGGVPDSCQYASGDLDLDGVTDTADLGFLLLLFDSTGPIGDLDGDGIVTTADLALLLLNFE